jgi:hypothetical protein
MNEVVQSVTVGTPDLTISVDRNGVAELAKFLGLDKGQPQDVKQVVPPPATSPSTGCHIQ